MFKVFPVSLQTFINTPNCVLEDPVQYSTFHIPHVFCDGHLQVIDCVGIVRIHYNRQVQRDFDHPVHVISAMQRDISLPLWCIPRRIGLLDPTRWYQWLSRNVSRQLRNYVV
jgi:hypothetical protein